MVMSAQRPTEETLMHTLHLNADTASFHQDELRHIADRRRVVRGFRRPGWRHRHD
jgi:hypothetical protein